MVYTTYNALYLKICRLRRALQTTINITLVILSFNMRSNNSKKTIMQTPQQTITSNINNNDLNLLNFDPKWFKMKDHLESSMEMLFFKGWDKAAWTASWSQEVWCGLLVWPRIQWKVTVCWGLILARHSLIFSSIGRCLGLTRHLFWQISIAYWLSAIRWISLVHGGSQWFSHNNAWRMPLSSAVAMLSVLSLSDDLYNRLLL